MERCTYILKTKNENNFRTRQFITETRDKHVAKPCRKMTSNYEDISGISLWNVFCCLH